MRAAVLASAVALALVGCASPRPIDGAATKIKHVVIIVQENRSFDNLFHGYPGADTVHFGVAHDGTKVLLQPVSLTARYDVRNSFELFQSSYDHGKMDGYDLRPIGPRPGAVVPLVAAQYPQYAFVPRSETEPYWQMARRFVLADRMFQSNVDQSFAAHLYLIAGQASGVIDIPNGRPWGCDAPPGATVQRLEPDGHRNRAFPCFSFPTLADQLNAKSLTWAYYAPKVHGYRLWRRDGRPRRLNGRHTGAIVNTGELWSAFDAIAAERYGPDWPIHVVSPSSAVLADIRAASLPNVAWVVPDWQDSDHAFSQSATGPSWVASIVNEIGRSRYWSDTVVLITWDDSGGWYDHVPPPKIDAWVLARACRSSSCLRTHDKAWCLTSSTSSEACCGLPNRYFRSSRCRRATHGRSTCRIASILTRNRASSCRSQRHSERGFS